MSETQFCKALTLTSLLLLAAVFLLFGAPAQQRNDAAEPLFTREHAPSASPAVSHADRQPATVPLQALRSGYSAYEMHGIVGRIGFEDGVLYVENRNRFAWRNVRLVLDGRVSHNLERIPPQAVERLDAGERPHDVRVIAAAENQEPGVLAFSWRGNGTAND